MRAVLEVVVVALGCTCTIVASVHKRQVNIGEFYFPKTASFPDNGWTATETDKSEPIYDEVLALPKEKKLDKTDKHDETILDALEGTTLKPRPGFIKPTPPSAPPRAIFSPSTAKPIQPKRPNAETSVTKKLKSPSTSGNYSSKVEATTTVKSPKKTTSEDSTRSLNEGLKQIRVSPADSPDVLMDKEYEDIKAGYRGRIIIDLRGDRTDEISARRRPIRLFRCIPSRFSRHRRPAPSSSDPESSESRILSIQNPQKNPESPDSSEIGVDSTDSPSECQPEVSGKRRESRRLARRSRPMERESAEGIFGNLLLVRRDISGLRQDLREVKQLVSEINRKQKVTTDSKGRNGHITSKFSSDEGVELLEGLDLSQEHRREVSVADSDIIPRLDENSSEPSETSKVIPSLLMITKTTVIPAQAKGVATFIPREKANENSSTNDSDGSVPLTRLGVLGNLTVETAHQVFPIIIQSSGGKIIQSSTGGTGGNHSVYGSSAPGSGGFARRPQGPLLIAADLLRSRFVLDSGRESAKHGELIRISDENGGKLRSEDGELIRISDEKGTAKHDELIRINDENGKLKLEDEQDDRQSSAENAPTAKDPSAAYSGGSGKRKEGSLTVSTDWKKEMKFENTRWPFNVDTLDAIDFSMDSDEMVIPREEHIVRFAPQVKPTSKNFRNSVPQGFRKTSTVNTTGTTGKESTVASSTTRVTPNQTTSGHEKKKASSSVQDEKDTTHSLNNTIPDKKDTTHSPSNTIPDKKDTTTYSPNNSTPDKKDTTHSPNNSIPDKKATTHSPYNSTKTPSTSTPSPQPTTTLEVERYTYKDPESQSSTDVGQKTTTSRPSEAEIGVEEYHSTQQAALWPDVLFQGG